MKYDYVFGINSTFQHLVESIPRNVKADIRDRYTKIIIIIKIVSKLPQFLCTIAKIKTRSTAFLHILFINSNKTC